MDLRQTRREELAKLLERDLGTLSDTAHLTTDLALDSLAMMQIVAWLHGHGVTIDLAGKRPETIGELLSLVDHQPAVRMRVTAPNGEVIGPRTAVQSDPLAPVLQDEMVLLDAVVPGDTGFLFDLMSRPENCYRWRYRGAPPPYERFAADLWNGIMVQFVVRRMGDRAPIGHVLTYGANPSLHFTYLGAVFVPGVAGTGLAAHASALFVRYLFRTFPLQKIYLEVPGFNWEQMHSGEGRLFTVEGILREHSYHDGRYWDEYLCAIYRDERIHHMEWRK
jgi:RimJ/RimL family protein N-acetyltransferase/aryl carrier-like protein